MILTLNWLNILCSNDIRSAFKLPPQTRGPKSCLHQLVSAVQKIYFRLLSKFRLRSETPAPARSTRGCGSRGASPARGSWRCRGGRGRHPPPGPCRPERTSSWRSCHWSAQHYITYTVTPLHAGAHEVICQVYLGLRVDGSWGVEGGVLAESGVEPVLAETREHAPHLLSSPRSASHHLINICRRKVSL